MANKLSDTSKELLRELNQSDLRAQTVNNATTSAVREAQATKAVDMKAFYPALEIASRVAARNDVDEYFDQIKTNHKVSTGNKVVDEELFNKDYEEFKTKYNELANWLKLNIPANPLAGSEIYSWQKKHLKLLEMKKQVPSKNDPKYLKETFEAIPLSGTEALQIVRDIQKTFNNELENTLQQFINEDRLQFKSVHFTDEEWKFLKMAYKFGLTNTEEFMLKIKDYGLNSWIFDMAILFDSFEDYLKDREQRIRSSKCKLEYIQSNYNKDKDPNDAEFVTKSRLFKQLNTPENMRAIKLVASHKNAFNEYCNFKNNAAKDIPLL